VTWGKSNAIADLAAKVYLALPFDFYGYGYGGGGPYLSYRPGVSPRGCEDPVWAVSSSGGSCRVMVSPRGCQTVSWVMGYGPYGVYVASRVERDDQSVG
jgi:hypothetical protein